jgi:phosphoglucomutase
VGVAVKEKSGYRLLNGNMTGILLTEYILSQQKVQGILPANGAVISTVVSTDMTRSITDAYGISYIDVLTGFKYIGEKIKEFEASGEYSYLFGFEESYGCLSGTYTRDKDAVGACMLICEMAAFYQAKGMSLLDALDSLYVKYGYFNEAVESITLKGVEGLADMKKIMAGLRENPPIMLAGTKVTEARDYLRQEKRLASGEILPTMLPVSDVLYYSLADGSWACVRPSGTEPKIKLYFGTRVEGDINQAPVLAEKRLGELAAALKEIIF